MEIYCVYCGKKFTPSPFFLKNARFCSIKCRNDYRDYIVEGKTPPSKTSPPKSQRPLTEKRFCLKCGTEFTPTNGSQKFCSEQCRAKSNNEARRKIKQCEICGKDFTTSKGAQTCCDDCREYIKEYKPTTETTSAPLEKTTRKTLDDWAREADEVGMSYGKYRHAVEKLGKTYEELKAAYERKKESD